MPRLQIHHRGLPRHNRSGLESRAVLDSVETDKSVAWINDTRGVILASGGSWTNTVEVVRGIRRCCRISVWRFLRAQSVHHLRRLGAIDNFHQ